MNLSEKLAAVEDSVDENGVPAKLEPKPRPTRAELLGRGKIPAGQLSRDEAWSDSKRQVQQMVLSEVRPSAADLQPEQLRIKVRSTVNEILEREDIGISPTERQRFVDEMLEDSLGFGPLEALLADGTITEIMCNAFDDIWIERSGMLQHSDVVFTSNDQYRRIIERMVAAVGRRVDESSPMVDARLADGSRINAIVPPLAVKAPVLTIRKFPERPLSMEDLIEKGSVSLEAAQFLEACVRGRISLVVVGGTGTGKTTMLNVLSDYIPHGERLITIEESAELQLRLPHTVTLESRPSNAEGSGEVRIRDLVRNSLRMRPDRIIVGECRGAETLDMLQAMNTGHPGSMTTVHANTPREVLARLETMVLMGGVELPQRAIREQIVMAVGLIVQLQRTIEGARVISSITELQGMEGDAVLLQDVFHRVGMAEGSGHLAPSGLRPKLLDELSANGVNLDPSMFRPLPPPPSSAVLSRSERRSMASRAARVEPPSDRLYDYLSQQRDGRDPVTTLAMASYQINALVAALCIGGGLAITVVALLQRRRSQQRTLAAILDDTMGMAPIPVEVASEAPSPNETSAFTARLGDAFGRLDRRGGLEQRLERADIPLRAGEFIAFIVIGCVILAVALWIMSGTPIVGVIVAVLAGLVAWKLPERKSKKRAKLIQQQLPDALSLMGASVEGGQTFQRSIDMYRHDARPPLSTELDRVMAEVMLGTELVVALENMADRCDVGDLKWAVEAVRIQQSTGGRLGPILHTLANFMRMRQEVRREVQTLSAEGRVSGYVLFGLPIFLALAISVEDPGYLDPMLHGTGLMVLMGAAGLMVVGWLMVRKMVNIKI